VAAAGGSDEDVYEDAGVGVGVGVDKVLLYIDWKERIKKASKEDGDKEVGETL
jgi:hypothetical protein